MPNSVIEIQNLSKSFGAHKALNDLNFSLPEGAFLSVFGPNGAGKTTLLRVLSTLTHQSAGSARVLSYDLKKQPDDIRERIGYISHRSMLYLDLTAEDNLTLAARLYGVSEPAKRVAELLSTVELTARRHDSVRTFSRGMTQRLSIARALVHDPKLVFLDEPYSGLDPHAVEIFDALIEKIREGRSFVMVSHDLQKGFELASHVLMLAKGRQVMFCEKTALDPESFAARYHAVVGMGVA